MSHRLTQPSVGELFHINGPTTEKSRWERFEVCLATRSISIARLGEHRIEQCTSVFWNSTSHNRTYLVAYAILSYQSDIRCCLAIQLQFRQALFSSTQHNFVGEPFVHEVSLLNHLSWAFCLERFVINYICPESVWFHLLRVYIKRISIIVIGLLLLVKLTLGVLHLVTLCCQFLEL